MEGNKANPEDYILVGGEYYKNSRCQDDTGRIIIQRIPWSKWRLNLDFKSNPADKDLIPRYDAFYNDPRHIGYKINQQSLEVILESVITTVIFICVLL